MSTVTIDELKRKACALIDAEAEHLVEVSRQIHAHPELNLEERFAHDLLTASLADHGIDTERSAYGVETGFAAVAGSAGPTVAVLCEYDALPGIGHACGHNVIAAAGLGAGLALAAIADEAGGRVRILGTPAEEGGGGKILMGRNGAFDDLAAAMMVHPADDDLIKMDTIALHALSIRYRGRAAHAAAAPWHGRNALDAAVLGYMNVATLRQHIRPDERVHGVFVNGGEKPNIVPAEASMTWVVRSPTMGSLDELKPRVLACLEAGATACGCTSESQWFAHSYADMIDNGPLVAAYVDNAASVGRTVRDPRTTGAPVVGSTDMGNVSYLAPSIHPMIRVAEAGVAIHTEDFARFAGAEAGDRAAIDGAKILAMTAIDVWQRAGLADEARAAFAAELERRPAVDVLALHEGS